MSVASSILALDERLEYIEQLLDGNERCILDQVRTLDSAISSSLEHYSSVTEVHNKLVASRLSREVVKLEGISMSKASNSDKKSLVLAKLDSLERIYSELEQFQSITMPLPIQSAKLAELRDSLPYMQSLIDQIVETVEELSIRTAQFCKEWADGVNRRNRTWLEFDRRLRNVEKLIAQKNGSLKRDASFLARYR